MTNNIYKTMIAFLITISFTISAKADVSDNDLLAEAGDDWVQTNGNLAGHRYSTLGQINANNASNLKVDWIYSTGGATNAQGPVIEHDNLLFFVQDNSIHAIHADSGIRAWRYDYEMPEDFGGQFNPFFTGKHRGAAISGSNVYALTSDCTLIALNYKSGEETFSHKIDRPYPRDFETTADGNGYFCTSNPVAIPGGKIIVPMNATDTGGLQGYVHAHSAATGEQLWAAPMIPQPGEPGADTWPGDSRIYGGAGPWIAGSYDHDLKMYFTGTANAYPWNPYGERQGAGSDGGNANVGAAAIEAVNTDTGEVVWRYTVVPGDPWDYDAMHTPVIVEINNQKTLVQANKTGYMHYLDAATGKFLQAPAIADKITWANGYDSDGNPIWAQAVPEEGVEITVWPGLLGAVNMSPVAYNPGTQMIYLPRRESDMAYTLEKVQVTSNVRNLGAAFEIAPTGLDKQVNSAHNIVSGKENWRNEVDQGGDSGGMLTTGGNITAYSTQGGVITVLNATTGEELFSLNTNSNNDAAGSTYMVNGKQHIAFTFGGLPTFGTAGDIPVNNAGLIISLSVQ